MTTNGNHHLTHLI